MTLKYLWAKVLKKIRLSAVKNSSIHATSKVESGSQIVNSVFEKHSFCGYDCEITNCDVGSFCSIANGVIIGGGMHPASWVSTSPVFYEGRDSVKAKFSEHKRKEPKRTIVEHDVWIGQNSLIKQGVRLSVGSIIGMGSVVTKDVPPYSIVAGVPAKLIRYRFEEEIINKLLKSEWWNLSDEDLKEHAKYFKSPENFLKIINQ